MFAELSSKYATVADPYSAGMTLTLNVSKRAIDRNPARLSKFLQI